MRKTCSVSSCSFIHVKIFRLVGTADSIQQSYQLKVPVLGVTHYIEYSNYFFRVMCIVSFAVSVVFHNSSPFMFVWVLFSSLLLLLGFDDLIKNMLKVHVILHMGLYSCHDQSISQSLFNSASKRTIK